MTPDPYRDALLDLLGLIGSGELAAFGQLAEDAGHAPSRADRIRLSGLAAAQFAHFDRVREQVAALGADPLAVMEPFHRAVEVYHEFTRPRSWLEALVKHYLGAGFAADFYREMAGFLGPGTRELAHEVLTDDGPEFVVEAVAAAVRADAAVSGRLALWGRRVLGEALSQGQRVAADRPALTGLLAGGDARGGLDLAAVSRMFTRLTDGHAARMERLGLG